MISKLITSIKDRIQGKVPLLGKRSNQWPKYEHAWLAVNGECAACGAKEKLQVHHVKPFHLDPSLELDFNNYISLCEAKGGPECHLHIGHHGNFKNENPAVREEAAVVRKKAGLPDLTTTIPQG